jgi:class 3 adenylate cyclase
MLLPTPLKRAKHTPIRLGISFLPEALGCEVGQVRLAGQARSCISHYCDFRADCILVPAAEGSAPAFRFDIGVNYMPLFMDIHDLPGVTLEDVAKAHHADEGVQGKYGVSYVKYWLNQNNGKVYCMCEAPNAEAANAVHKEAHGLAAEKIVEVTEDLAELFMGDAPISAHGAVMIPGSAERDSGVRTVLFTDIVGSTNMTQQLGDEKAMEVLEVHDRAVRAALTSAGGREVKHTGDGIMAAFTSAAAAIRCSVAVQNELARHNREDPSLPLQVRIGLAAGEPVERHNDLFGSTVQLAARLCAHAEPEQILVSNTVAELCLGKCLAFRDLGDVTLKGFVQPMRVHTVVVIEPA